MLLNNQWTTKEIKEEIKRIPKDGWKWRHDDLNLWDAAKAVLRRKFIVIQAYPRKQETSHKNNLKKLEKENQTKPKVRRKEIIKIRAEINEIEIKQ